MHKLGRKKTVCPTGWTGDGLKTIQVGSVSSGDQAELNPWNSPDVSAC